MLNNQLITEDLFCEAKKLHCSVLSSDIRDCLDFLLPISGSYPKIDNWFMDKVVPGLYDGSRKLFIHRRSGQIVALGIAKKTRNELKICTVRVSADYIGKGLGVRIFKEAMSWLGTDMPHLTVSEEKLSEFEKIFHHFGYKLTSTIKGIYHPNSVEYFFNESKSFK